jgi:hypothetical protein
MGLAMSLLSEPFTVDLSLRPRDAGRVTVELMSDLLHDCCRRFPSQGRRDKTARVEALIKLGAWIDAALALLDLELPQWQVRRLAYDDGEWYCSLSRERELPDWLDQSIDTHHADLAVAILSALLEAKQITAQSSRPSVPGVKRHVVGLYRPMLSDNFA